jgi:hypothetical protein
MAIPIFSSATADGARTSVASPLMMRGEALLRFEMILVLTGMVLLLMGMVIVYFCLDMA